MSMGIARSTFYRILITLILVLFVLPSSTDADAYPKLANYYLNWDMTDEQAKELAKWDVVVISPQALDRNPRVIDIMRRHNPSIIILAYVLSQEINHQVAPTLPAGDIWKEIYNVASANNWWLRSSSGDHITQWPNTWMINSSSMAPRVGGINYSEYLPGLVATKILYKNSPWDGVFYDNMFHDVSWLNAGDIDITGDGIRDSAEKMDEAWRAGMHTIARRTRELAPGKIIIGNMRRNTYTPSTNGRLTENFPEYPRGAWAGQLKDYLQPQIGHKPEIFILNKSSNTPFFAGDFPAMRFGLASALMGSGFYSFDWGMSHNELWWYDEYDVFLGRATTEPKNLLGSSASIVPSVWRRDFQNGVALLNATEKEQRITFSEDLEKVRGIQDPATNNGALIRSLMLKPADGIILIRRVEEVVGAPYQNGSFIRPFNAAGDALRNGFYAYTSAYPGGSMVAVKDLNGDGRVETIVADTSRVRVFDDTSRVVASWYPYGTKHTAGITFALGDMNNDNLIDIVTGTGRGASPEVKIFDYAGKQIGASFFAYAKSFTGGVNVAVCDLNGNGNKQIVTGAGHLGGPQVRVFDPSGRVLSGGFFAYASTFRGGVYVACGDVTGDTKEEIVTGAGFGGSSHIRLFDGKGKVVMPGFFAFGADTRDGVRVFIADLDGDGRMEILAAGPNT